MHILWIRRLRELFEKETSLPAERGEKQPTRAERNNLQTVRPQVLYQGGSSEILEGSGCEHSQHYFAQSKCTQVKGIVQG